LGPLAFSYHFPYAVSLSDLGSQMTHEITLCPEPTGCRPLIAASSTAIEAAAEVNEHSNTIRIACIAKESIK
jgi:hypothetical protein